MEHENVSDSEVKSWLTALLTEDKREIVSFEINGTSEKGAGQCGEVIFVTVIATDTQDSTKTYNLALKTSKSKNALMSQSPVIRDTFINEIYMYREVFPIFKKFQTDRGIQDFFDSIPRCYGAFGDEDKHIIALENMDKSDYHMWDPCTPLTQEHVELVIKDYAKFHAISIAMQELEPDSFQQLVNGFVNVHEKIFATSVNYFKNNVRDLRNLFKEEFDQNVLKKLEAFAEEVHFLCCDMHPEVEDYKVITHGDCWSNNFMYKYEDKEKSLVSRVTFLDWQISRLSSPVCDLSYFLFECISEDTIAKMDTILRLYYDTFSCFLVRLGVSGKGSFNDFLRQWKKFSKYGLMMAIVLIKASYMRNKDWSKTKTDFKNRLKPVLKYATEEDVI